VTAIFFSAPDLAFAGSALARIAALLPASIAVVGGALLASAVASFAPVWRETLRRRAAAGEFSIARHVAATWRLHLAVVLLVVVAARVWLARTPPSGAFVYQAF
ncbi:MAG TPA: hypothetical protein VKE69_04525, partial [Planctomycetota bacterium]|nr:hypothetical protein [Planctomycetota bacterium]